MVLNDLTLTMVAGGKVFLVAWLSIMFVTMAMNAIGTASGHSGVRFCLVTSSLFRTMYDTECVAIVSGCSVIIHLVT